MRCSPPPPARDGGAGLSSSHRASLSLHGRTATRYPSEDLFPFTSMVSALCPVERDVRYGAEVQVSFADDDLGRLCSCLDRLCQRWGHDGGTRVGRRLWELRHAPDLRTLQALPGRCRPDGVPPGWMIDVAEVATIHFSLIEVPETRPPSEGIRITKISDRSTRREEANRVSAEASKF